MKPKTIAILTANLGLLITALQAAEWPQYRGLNHDGSTTEPILTKWPASGLREIWKEPLHAGFSSLSVGEAKVFTIVSREVEGASQEVCVALDAKAGKELWAAPLGIAKYDGGGDRGTSTNNGGDGPRSTPSLSEGRVYVMSAKLILKCLDAESGKVEWSKDIISEFSGRNLTWQNAASPLVEGGLVFVAGGGAGQALIAFDKKDGHVVWKGQDDRMTHSTPVAATILGQRQVIFFTQTGLVSVAPETGSVLWRYPFRYATSTAMSPVVYQDMVFCSAGYGVGGGACKITKEGDEFKATRLWFEAGNGENNHWSTPVCRDGYIYGLFGHAQFGTCPLKCIDIATGKVMWTKDGFGPGGVIQADGNIMVLSDAGDLILVKADSTAYTEEARSHILDGKCWNVPAVSGGRLYARSTKEGVCLDISP